MEHILLRQAFRYRQATELTVSGFDYEPAMGAWIEKGGKTYLVEHASFPVCGTKKFDVETGEDAKGQ